MFRLQSFVLRLVTAAEISEVPSSGTTSFSSLLICCAETGAKTTSSPIIPNNICFQRGEFINSDSILNKKSDFILLNVAAYRSFIFTLIGTKRINSFSQILFFISDSVHQDFYQVRKLSKLIRKCKIIRNIRKLLSFLSRIA